MVVGNAYWCHNGWSVVLVDCDRRSPTTIQATSNGVWVDGLVMQMGSYILRPFRKDIIFIQCKDQRMNNTANGMPNDGNKASFMLKPNHISEDWPQIPSAENNKGIQLSKGR